VIFLNNNKGRRRRPKGRGKGKKGEGKIFFFFFFSQFGKRAYIEILPCRSKIEYIGET